MAQPCLLPLTGSYSFIPVGASGKTYDQLALPVRRRVCFAGEHTCRLYPDTVGGAMISGAASVVVASWVLAFPSCCSPRMALITCTGTGIAGCWCASWPPFHVRDTYPVPCRCSP